MSCYNSTMVKKEIWTKQKIKKGFESFYNQHGYYPTATEVDLYDKLPSSRQIQRNFGGLPALRKELGLTGPLDFTKGEHSSKRSKMIGQRSHKAEKEVYLYLVSRFGQPFVHREYFFNDDRRTRTDFYVYCASDTFSIDVFYPNSLKNMNLCLNSKLISYKGLAINYPVIFLVMNHSIIPEQIEKLMLNKKNKLLPNQRVLTFDQFKDFCNKKERAFIK